MLGLPRIIHSIPAQANAPAAAEKCVAAKALAATWSDALGTPVAYVGDDDEAIDAALTAHLTGYRLEDWKSSFKALRGFAVKTKQAELDATTRLLGRPPTDFTDFVRRVVEEHGLAPNTKTRAVGIPGASQTEGALR